MSCNHLSWAEILRWLEHNNVSTTICYAADGERTSFYPDPNLQAKPQKSPSNPRRKTLSTERGLDRSAPYNLPTNIEGKRSGDRATSNARDKKPLRKGNGVKPIDLNAARQQSEYSRKLRPGVGQRVHGKAGMRRFEHRDCT